MKLKKIIFLIPLFLAFQIKQTQTMDKAIDAYSNNRQNAEKAIHSGNKELAISHLTKAKATLESFNKLIASGKIDLIFNSRTKEGLKGSGFKVSNETEFKNSIDEKIKEIDNLIASPVPVPAPAPTPAPEPVPSPSEETKVDPRHAENKRKDDLRSSIQLLNYIKANKPVIIKFYKNFVTPLEEILKKESLLPFTDPERVKNLRLFVNKLASFAESDFAPTADQKIELEGFQKKLGTFVF